MKRISFLGLTILALSGFSVDVTAICLPTPRYLATLHVESCKSEKDVDQFMPEVKGKVINSVEISQESEYSKLASMKIPKKTKNPFDGEEFTTFLSATDDPDSCENLEKEIRGIIGRICIDWGPNPSNEYGFIPLQKYKPIKE